MIKAYYNEIDPYCCAWLRNLMDDGHITPGGIDDRPIQELTGDDLRGYDRVHLFAGIAGWELALQLAGWPSDKPIWTGSCPCQPFSVAGNRKGTADERHLWPEMFRLIRECKPQYVIGEQVEGAVKHGWLDGVFTDLEREKYTCGAAVLGAHSAGAPHSRQRLFWVAKGLEYPASEQMGFPRQPRQQRDADFWGNYELVYCADGKTRRIESGSEPLASGISGRVAVRRTIGQGDAAIQEEHWYNRTGALRAFGNAIVPQVAAEIIKAYLGEDK